MGNLEYTSIANALAFVHSTRQKIDEAVDKELSFPKMNRWDRAGFSKHFLWIFLVFFTGLGIGIAGGVLYQPAYDSQSSFDLGVGLITLGALIIALFCIVIFYFSYRQKKVMRNIKLDVNAIYRKFFGEHFENVRISKDITRFEAKEIIKRPSEVPITAVRTKLHPGVSGTFNDLAFKTYWAEWKWFRPYAMGDLSNGDHSMVYEALGVEISDVNSRYEKFKVTLIYPSSKLRPLTQIRKRSENLASVFKMNSQLENTEFEKHTILKTNDQVALRRFLTPYMQESILKRIALPVGITEVRIENGSFNMLQRDGHECFKVNFPYTLNTERFKNVYKKDLVEDIAHFLAFISQLNDFKTLA